MLSVAPRSRFALCLFCFALALPRLSAQTTVGTFTSSGSFQTIKIGSNNFSDAYDSGNANADPSKQNQLNGASQNLDLVGNATFPLLQIATGTVTGGADAIAIRTRMAAYSASQGVKQTSLIILFQNNSSVFGVGFSVDSSNNFVLAGVTSNANTTFNSQYQFTVGTTLASGATDAANRYTYVQSDSNFGGNNKPDAFLTFWVLASELTAISPGFSFGSTTGVSAFTNQGGNNLTSGGINADYVTADNTAGGQLAFGSTSGSTTPIPEFPTALIVGAAALPLLGFQLWRRRKSQRLEQSA
jgi:hypothetical protein